MLGWLREELLVIQLNHLSRLMMPPNSNEVINEVPNVDAYEDLVKYLFMVCNKVKEPKVDSKFIYAHAKLDRIGDIEEFIV